MHYVLKRKDVCLLVYQTMSLFRHFEPIKEGTLNVCKQASSIVSKHASSGALCVSEKEATKVAEELRCTSTQSSEVGKTSRTQHPEKNKMRIARYASLHGYRQFAGPRHINFSWFNNKQKKRLLLV